MKQHYLIVAAAIIALAGGIAASRYGASPTPPRQTGGVKFTLPDLAGAEHDIDEWRGKTRVVNFWATWCPPCLKEIPEFVRLQDELAVRNVQFIGIAIEEREPVAEFVAAHPINYPVLIGGDAGIALSRQLGNVVGAVPFTVVVSPEGQLIYRHPGELSRARLLEVLQPYID